MHEAFSGCNTLVSTTVGRKGPACWIQMGPPAPSRTLMARFHYMVLAQLYSICLFCFSIRKKYLVPPFLVPALLGFQKKLTGYYEVLKGDMKTLQTTYWSERIITASLRHQCAARTEYPEQCKPMCRMRSMCNLYFLTHHNHSVPQSSLYFLEKSFLIVKKIPVIVNIS